MRPTFAAVFAAAVMLIGVPAEATESGQYGPWTPVAHCESHGNPATNTGNGFYGLVQFTPSTWRAVALDAGRPDLAGVLPHQATAADQLALADHLAFGMAGGGLGHWPVCGAYYGGCYQGVCSAPAAAPQPEPTAPLPADPSPPAPTPVPAAPAAPTAVPAAPTPPPTPPPTPTASPSPQPTATPAATPTVIAPAATVSRAEPVTSRTTSVTGPGALDVAAVSAFVGVAAVAVGRLALGRRR